jgi:hypothetical protein
MQMVSIATYHCYLVCVYTVRTLLLLLMHTAQYEIKFEYTINQVCGFLNARGKCLNTRAQGISPTLIYPVPDVKVHPILGRIVKSLRDYYPLWQVSNIGRFSFQNRFSPKY